MFDKKYYCFCGSNCRYETMTKEQILTAITEAVKNGSVGDVDTGFITTIKTINGGSLRFFVGLQEEFEALPEEDKQNCLALITNDTSAESINSAIEDLTKRLDEFESGLRYGDFVVDYARSADSAETAETDSHGNVIAEKYVASVTTNISGVVIGTEYALPELPDGKSIRDIFAVAFDARTKTHGLRNTATDYTSGGDSVEHFNCNGAGFAFNGAASMGFAVENVQLTIRESAEGCFIKVTCYDRLTTQSGLYSGETPVSVWRQNESGASLSFNSQVTIYFK